MNEREIFENAIEIPDRRQRDAFLDQACGVDAELRCRLAELLASHDQASGFLNVPVVDQIPPSVPSGQAPTLELSPITGATRAESGSDDDDDPPGAADVSFLQPSTKPDSLGRLGHYEIFRILGQGAVGIVFKAFDEKLHRHVAVKVMSPQLAATSPPRKRFLREARSVAAIKHENIVQVHSVEEQPLPYLVMEYIDGQTLQQKLDGAGPLDVPEILHLGRQMAAGLAAAHDKGLIHRDIKPGNILLEAGAEQKVKITDFGLARAADDATMTRTGTIAGTPMYMAPEQAMGQELDHRADLFSLGSVLYQMACGRPPFRGPNAIAVLKRVVDEQPRPIRDVLPDAPEWLCKIIEKLHAKTPNERYQSAKEVADLLALCQNELQVNGKVACVAVPSPAGRASSRQLTPTTAIPDAVVPKVERASATLTSRGPLLFVATTFILIVGFALFELTGISNFFRSRAGNSHAVAILKDGEIIAKVDDTKGVAEMVSAKPPAESRSTHVPPLAIAPFDAEKARAHQEAWAKHLGVPIEFTNSIGMKFRLIPPGEFTMGMTKEEAEALAALNPNDEHWTRTMLSSSPANKVRLTQAYYLGTSEVTQEQYEKVVGVNPSHFSASGEGKELVKDEDTRQHPVERVSYIDAAEFCIHLSKQEQLKPVYFSGNNVVTLLSGDGYRLPTEAEWEYACRAGTNTSWFTGERESSLLNVAWWGGNAGGRTHSVGQLKANPFGLYDVTGNVWEWCQDWYDPELYSKRGQNITEEPQGPAEGSDRVLRGGSWVSDAARCRSALRLGLDPSLRTFDFGFRLALSFVGVRAKSGPDKKE